MKYSVKYFLTRITAICLLIAAIAYVYENTMYISTLESEGWLKSVGDGCFKKRADGIYFSASPNESHAENDKDKRTIHEMIQSLYGKYSIASLDTGSIHAGIFLYALKQMPADYQPKFIVMDMNIRSLGVRWLNSGLENSMQRNLVYWNHRFGLLNRMNAALKNYEYLPMMERNELINYDDKFYHLPFKDSCRTVKLWFDSLQRRPDKADKIGLETLQHFGFEVTNENKMLRYYDQIVTFCNKRKIPLYYLILPENLEGMEKNSGTNLRRLCIKNSNFVKSHYKNRNVTLIDAVDKLNSSYFYETYTTEHYTAAGREIVAKEVVEVLKRK